MTVLFGLVLMANAQDKPATAPRYKDASLPIQDRVADLLARMTLEEKIDQITDGWETRVNVVDPTGTYTEEQARKVLSSEWLDEQKLPARQFAILRNSVQRYQLEKTRLGIPEMFLSEGLHGVMEYGSTSYPQALRPWVTRQARADWTRCFHRCWTLRAIHAGAAPRRLTAKIRTWCRALAWRLSKACRATTS